MPQGQFIPIKELKRKESVWSSSFKTSKPYFIISEDYIPNNGRLEKVYILKKKLTDPDDKYEVVYPDEGKTIF